MKRRGHGFVAGALLTLAVIVTIAGFAFKAWRKYRIAKYTVQAIEGVAESAASYLDEKEGIQITAEAKEPDAKLTYSTDKDSVYRYDPVVYLNASVGTPTEIDVGYKTHPLVITFTPLYENGYLYGDGSQEALSEDEYLTYTSDQGIPWYTQYPYTYKNRKVGKEYSDTPIFNNPHNISLTFVAEYNAGILYPDGHQEQAIG